MKEAVIVEAVRTPIGRRNGVLSGVHPADLLADLMLDVVERSGIDPEAVDDVLIGCMEQIGEQANTIGRIAWLAAGLPEVVPATTIERQCISSQQAIHFAAQGIMAGAYDIVLAGGVESRPRIISDGARRSAIRRVCGTRRGRSRYAVHDDLGGIEVTQFTNAELIAERFELDREELDRFGLRSHQRAAAARERGEFAREIRPVRVVDDGAEILVAEDEGIRPGANLEKMATLKPVSKENGVVTAAQSSQISDGAAMLLLMSREEAERRHLVPRARLVAADVIGDNFMEGLTAPIPATRRALSKAGISIDDLDAVEINEAFASVVLAWRKELKVDPDWFEEHVNPRGGAIALGHPIGCSGARLAVTLLHELEDSNGRFGLQTMCGSHGLGAATIWERLG